MRDFAGGCPITTSSIPMKILCWNCKGLGHPLTVRAAKQLARKYKPNLCFLMETKTFVQQASKVGYMMGFEYSYSSDSHGRVGGLWVG